MAVVSLIRGAPWLLLFGLFLAPLAAGAAEDALAPGAAEDKDVSTTPLTLVQAFEEDGREGEAPPEKSFLSLDWLFGDSEDKLSPDSDDGDGLSDEQIEPNSSIEIPIAPPLDEEPEAEAAQIDEDGVDEDAAGPVEIGGAEIGAGGIVDKNPTKRYSLFGSGEDEEEEAPQEPDGSPPELGAEPEPETLGRPAAIDPEPDLAPSQEIAPIEAVEEVPLPALPAIVEPKTRNADAPASQPPAVLVEEIVPREAGQDGTVSEETGSTADEVLSGTTLQNEGGAPADPSPGSAPKALSATPLEADPVLAEPLQAEPGEDAPAEAVPEEEAEPLLAAPLPVPSMPTVTGDEPVTEGESERLGDALDELRQLNPVVALVQGEEIRWAEVLESAGDLPVKYQSQVEAIFPALLDRVIDMKLLALAARQEGLSASEDVRRRVTAYEDQLLRELYVKQRLGQLVTLEEVQARYDALVERLGSKQHLRARHILVDNEDQARDLVASLEAGADFATLARKNSIGPSADRGGDLGYFDPNRMVPEFSKAALAMEIGTITREPVKTPFGWHVIQLVDRRFSGVPPFEEMEKSLREQLTQEAMDGILSELRAENEIEFFPETPENQLRSLSSLEAPGAVADEDEAVAE